MHPASRKGPLHYRKHPPFSTFFYKKHPHFSLFLQKNRFPLFFTKHPPFHFLTTGLIFALYNCVSAACDQLYEQRVKVLLDSKESTESQQQLERVRRTRAEYFNILKCVRLARSGVKHLMS